MPVSEAASAASAASGASGASDSGDAPAADNGGSRLVNKVCKLLTQKNMTSKEHVQASKLLVKLQDDLATLPASAAVKLSILSMSLGRKLLKMRESAEEDEIKSFENTFILVFILIAAVHARESGETGSYDANALAQREKTLSELQTHSLWQQLCRHSRKRSRNDNGDHGDHDDNDDKNDKNDNDDGGFSDVHSLNSMPSTAGAKQNVKSGEYSFSSQKDVDELNSKMEKEREEAEKFVMRPFLTDPASSRWSEVLYNGRELASTIVSVAACKLQSVGEIQDMCALARAYARSMLNQSRSALLTTTRSSFMSLKVSSLMMLGNTGVADAVGSLVASSESESAQVVFRDILLSFLLPREFVGVRRTLLLPREVSAKATKEYSTYVSLAHESAICGVLDAFESNCELKRCCALLSALAMLTTGSDIRHDVAFGGRVLLPFLEVPEPDKKGALQLFLDVSQRNWTVFSTAGGKPQLELSGPGVETLETALVLLADDR